MRPRPCAPTSCQSAAAQTAARPPCPHWCQCYFALQRPRCQPPLARAAPQAAGSSAEPKCTRPVAAAPLGRSQGLQPRPRALPVPPRAPAPSPVAARHMRPRFYPVAQAVQHPRRCQRWCHSTARSRATHDRLQWGQQPCACMRAYATEVARPPHRQQEKQTHHHAIVKAVCKRLSGRVVT